VADPAQLVARKRARHNARYRDDIEFRERIKTRRREHARKRRTDTVTWPKHAWARLKYKAAAKNIPFNIEPDDITVPAACPVMLCPFVLGKQSEMNPSVDKLRPELGYVKGNVRVISKRANTMKSNCTDPQELRRLADYVEGKL
jgi:hypothetical protein